MKKGRKGRKFARKTDQRKAFLKSLVSALFLKEKIKTTKARAKEISSIAEKYITRAKEGDLAATRFLNEIFTKQITEKLIKKIAPQYKERKGGYTRIVKLGRRTTDGAELAQIELV